MMQKIFSFVILTALLMMTWAAAQENPPQFGEVAIKIDQQPFQTYIVQSAILYREVAIEYDTTLYLQTEKTAQLNYYPQLRSGHNNVIHLLLVPADSAEGGQSSSLDAYIDIGDTLLTYLEFTDADSMVFVFPNGRFSNKKVYSRNASAQIQLDRQQYEDAVSGSFELEFDFPLTENKDVYQHVQMKGVLSIPDRNLLRGDEKSIEAREQADHKKRLKRNLLIAVLASALLIVGILLR